MPKGFIVNPHRLDPYKNYNCLDTYLGDDFLGRFINYYRLEWGHDAAPADPKAPPGRRDGWPAKEEDNLTGGVPVLAHPRSPGYEIPDDVIESLAGVGLGGIEVFHFDHDETTRTRLTQLAKSLNLVMTGGSDDHGSYQPGGQPGRGLGAETTPQQEYERLLTQAS